ncbi:MAG: glycosyltransferase family 2 protein [Candidatus Thermoplasmatota archaeon]|nr:glycosyltransferase family 2 protein [Candidatus Thermoplasmatota archaeon]
MTVLLSVIVMAYNRKQYLLDALKSVINQDYPRESYEVIVSKNYADSDVDKFIQDNGMKSLTVGNVSQGEQLAIALNVAQGDIICLLDDDDEFTAKKLSTVERVFSEQRDLIYLHNEYKTKRNENLISKYKYKHLRKDLVVNAMTFSDYSKILRFGFLTNNSSISFKKCALLSHLDLIRKFNSRLDFTIFMLVMNQKGKMGFIGDCLTIYRIHESETHKMKGGYVDIFRAKLLEKWLEQDMLLLTVVSRLVVREMIELDSDIMLLNLRVLGFRSGLNGITYFHSLKFVFLQRNIYSLILVSFVTLRKFLGKTATRIFEDLVTFYYKRLY